jgi:hypothetical protein
MPIDFTIEEALTPAQAALECKFPGRGSKTPDPKTIVAWIVTGIQTSDGGRVFLDGRKCVGRWLTSREALQRFFIALDVPSGWKESTAPRTQSREAVAV